MVDIILNNYAISSAISLLLLLACLGWLIISKNKTIGKVIIASFLLILSLFYMVTVPGNLSLRAPAQSRATVCKSNCKNIGTALEMYASDNDKSFPPALSGLTPDYLKSIPTCASARKDTYSESYQLSGDFRHFTIFCSGENHKAMGYGSNYPQYNSVDGLIIP